MIAYVPKNKCVQQNYIMQYNRFYFAIKMLSVH